MAQGLIGVTDAAAALGVSASTVSRYIRKHPELNRAGEKERPQVDLEELRSHRQSTLVVAPIDSPQPQRQPKPATETAAPAPAADGTTSADRGPTGPSYAHSRAARESVRAYKERLELDEMLGRLVPRSEVEEAAHDAGQLLQTLLMELGPRLADELAVASDPGTIAARLEDEFRALLIRFGESLEVRKREYEAA